ncbi:GDSL-type esterase/lipase family protein [Microbacterium sp.]|uniref:GDSL-type esterase/lipase family protein n=1 Tax=Microbacterium sp. TaxID=51671 RepID=UPI00281124E7|nr:GDSL-type esterase/lipase family protein [Microbacterium sp.]
MTTLVSGAGWEPFVHGAGSLEPGSAGLAVHRYPANARVQVDDIMFRFAEACPVGVSLRFVAKGEVELTIAATTVMQDGGAAPEVALMVREGESERMLPLTDPSLIVIDGDATVREMRPRPPQTVRLTAASGGTVEVLLPHNARVELVALAADGGIEPWPAAGLRWTHYGSSISQGLNAVSASRTWPVAAAAQLGWRLRNLSIAGNAQLDGFAARVIRDQPADLITLKAGINLVNADSMRERTFRPAVHAFLDTIRERQPDTPIVLISALSCPIHEDSPGPVVTGEDGRARAARRAVEGDTGALTLSRSREILAEIVAARGDDRLAYWDGRELLGAADSNALYDGLHPDQGGLDLIADRFVAGIRERAGMGPADI